MSLFKDLREAHNWNTVHHARSIGKEATSDSPVLAELQGLVGGLKEAGYEVEKDGNPRRRVGWTIHSPDWKKDAVIYLNWYAGNSFNTGVDSDSYIADKVQYWPRWMENGKMPKLGKREWLDVKDLKNGLEKALVDFTVNQEKI